MGQFLETFKVQASNCNNEEQNEMLDVRRCLSNDHNTHFRNQESNFDVYVSAQKQPKLPSKPNPYSRPAKTKESKNPIRSRYSQMNQTPKKGSIKEEIFSEEHDNPLMRNRSLNNKVLRKD